MLEDDRIHGSAVALACVSKPGRGHRWSEWRPSSSASVPNGATVRCGAYAGLGPVLGRRGLCETPSDAPSIPHPSAYTSIPPYPYVHTSVRDHANERTGSGIAYTVGLSLGGTLRRINHWRFLKGGPATPARGRHGQGQAPGRTHPARIATRTSYLADAAEL